MKQTILTSIATVALIFAGIAGEKMVNVLQINLALRKQYGAPQ
jgi:K+-transporting ATPase c subunit